MYLQYMEHVSAICTTCICKILNMYLQYTHVSAIYTTYLLSTQYVSKIYTVYIC